MNVSIWRVCLTGSQKLEAATSSFCISRSRLPGSAAIVASRASLAVTQAFVAAARVGRDNKNTVTFNEHDELTSLVQPGRLWSRAEILAEPCPIPRSPGVYAWFFREIPPLVSVTGSIEREGLTLLYVGISPKKPTPGKKPSSEHIQSRICYHMGKTGRENANGSTLRMTLGCLLSGTLGIRLSRPGNRFTFGPGEAVLSDWLGRNALVAWMVHPEPWLIEDRAIAGLDLPLNLMGNGRHPFYRILKSVRSRAKAAARTSA